MSIRKKLKYPPYYNLCLIKLNGTNYEKLFKEANKIKEYLKTNTKDIIILGPSASTIPKIYNKYYIQIIIKYKNLKQIYDNLKFITDKSKQLNDIVLDIDIKPKKI